MSKKILTIKNKLTNEFIEWIELIISALPAGYIGKHLRSFYWMKRLQLSFPPTIARMARIWGDKNNIFLGEHFSCGEYSEINFCTSKGIYIGNNVLIARGVYIRAANHKIERLDLPINQQGHDAATINYKGKEYSIIIEDDVWIGVNVIILSGAKIGKGSVVAAGAVVTHKEFPPYSIIGGNPARVIRTRIAEVNHRSDEG